MVLLVAGLFNRLLGFFYQVTLIRFILPEGVGLFNMVYPIYNLILVIATAGIPVAISILVAEETARGNLRGAHQVFKICFIILIISSTFTTILSFLGTPWLLKYVFPNPKVFFIYLSLLPAIIVVSLCSAFRGYFQGLQQMVPTAVTQSIEQLVRVTAGLLFARFFLPQGIEYAAMGAALGVVIGEISGLIIITVIYLRKRSRFSLSDTLYYVSPQGNLIGRIFKLAFPVTLIRVVSTFLVSVDAVLIPQRLQVCGMDLTCATAVYGQFEGVSKSLLYIPMIITISMATALIPAVSDASASKNIKLIRARTEEAIRITLITCLPVMGILILLAEELCGLIFGYPEAGTGLKILAMGGIFFYLQQITTGILQGLGKTFYPFRNLVGASIFKIVGIYYLTGIPHLAINGTAGALVVSYMIMALLNLHDIHRLTGLRLNIDKIIIRPLIAVAGMGWLLIALQSHTYWNALSEPVAVTGAVVIGFIGYSLLLMANGGLEIKELQRIKDILFFSIRH
jgi:stage V sporulation protein B